MQESSGFDQYPLGRIALSVDMPGSTSTCRVGRRPVSKNSVILPYPLASTFGDDTRVSRSFRVVLPTDSVVYVGLFLAERG
jgi:hypothetical protein